MRVLTGALLFLVALVPLSASAALPPFELARKAIVEARAERGPFDVDLRVTRSGTTITEYQLNQKVPLDGTLRVKGKPPLVLGPEAPTAETLLWIALISADPVAEVSRRYGFVDADETEVGVEDDFVYVYGDSPRVSVARDMRRLVALEVATEGHRWRVRLEWDEGSVVGALVTRDGTAVLTARARK